MSSSQRRSFALGIKDIQQARDVLKGYLAPTPLIPNAWLSDALGCEVYLKLESMQPVGSFKIRGATYRISRLTPAERKRGVIAASAGNHAQGVAWGSQRLGTSALIVMPVGASLVKIQNTRALGAEVVLEGNGYDEAYQAARRIARKSGRVFVHAFEDPDIIAGQGTVGVEILEQLPDVEAVFGAIGGGGLMAGIGVAVKSLSPRVELVGCQASGAAAMVQAIRKGRDVRLARGETFADGIRVLQTSPHLRRLLSDRMDRLATASDEQMAAAILQLMEKAKLIAEGAGALPLAVLEQQHKRYRGKKVVLLVCGGNIDVTILGRIIERGLSRTGRRLRVDVGIADQPGSLARLTALIGETGANIIQAIHDRNEPKTGLHETDVALTLETRGPEHTRTILRQLRAHALRVTVSPETHL